MFKYYDALLNRSGDALAGHFVRLFDAAGNQVDIYADESETPIITESGVANAAKSDSDGMVRFYVASGEYDLLIYDANDVYLKREDGVPMISTLSDQMEAAQTARDAALAAQGLAETARDEALAARDDAEQAAVDAADVVQAVSDALAAGTVSDLVGDRIYTSRLALDADLVPDDNLYALVVGDPTPANNDLYQKNGATTTGSWDGPLGLFAAASAEAEASATAAAGSALAAAAAVSLKKNYSPPGRPARISIAERFTADGSVDSRHGGQSGQYQSAENVYNALAFESYGYPTVLRMHGKASDLATQNFPRGGFTMTPVDLAEIGIVPDDTTPPVVSIRGTMFLNEAVNQGVTSNVNLGQMWIMLRYNGANIIMSVGQNSSTDVTMVNDGTGVSSGPTGATSSPYWSSSTASISFESGVKKQWIRQNIKIPATFAGKALTGICVMFLGEVQANGASQYDCMAEIVAGATIAATGSYLNAGDQIEAETGMRDAPDIRVQVVGAYVYVRTSWDGTYDKVQRINVGYTPAANSNEAWDHDGERLIPIATADENTASAFNVASGFLHRTMRVGGDESPTIMLQSSTRLGGGHGIPGYQVTATSHGKSYADIGSTWSAGSFQWVLVRIIDANTLGFIVVPTGTYPAWSRSGSAPSGSTLTHVSGATNTGSITFSAPTGTQFWTALQDYSISVHVDGGPNILGTDASYSGNRIFFRERYGIVNYSALVTWFQGKAGTFAANPTTYAPSEVDTQVQISQTFVIDWTGFVATTSAYYAEQAFTGAHLGGAQLIAPDLTGGKELVAYVPRTATISGYDFSAGATITANNTDLFFTTAERIDADDPPSRVAMLALDSGTPLYGTVVAVAEGIGRGAPDVRAAGENTDFRISNSEKTYPYVAGDATAIAQGSLIEWTILSGTFNPAIDPDLNILFVAPEGAGYIVYAYATAALGKHWVPVDRRLIGQPVTARRADGCALVSTVVSERGVLVDFTDAKGEFEGVIA